MIRHLYIEREVLDLPLTQSIQSRFPHARQTLIDAYGEVFNTRAQNFRLQKREPAAILAKKHGKLLLPVPVELSLGADHSVYFSHALNCLYDCRYCFLQAMFASAHYVFFVNHEDFSEAIVDMASDLQPESVHFFSGYDCDSLAFEPITGFAARFVEVVRDLDNALLELRTKSTAIRSLLELEPSPNVVVAFSLSPEIITLGYDHKAPSLARRLEAISTLAEHGWNIGFRFDPLIWHRDFVQQYRELCARVFALVPDTQMHSVTIGALRFPRKQFARMVSLYPEEPLFAAVSVDAAAATASYPVDMVNEMRVEVERIVHRYIDSGRVFYMGENSA